MIYRKHITFTLHLDPFAFVAGDGRAVVALPASAGHPFRWAACGGCGWVYGACDTLSDAIDAAACAMA